MTKRLLRHTQHRPGLAQNKNLEISKKNQNKGKCVWPAPPPLVYTPRPLTPTARCQKLSYKFLFVSLFQRDGEELGLYTMARRRVYPAAPAPGTRESPHCCRWKQESVGVCVAGRRRWRRGGRSAGGAAERSSLSDSNLGTCTFYNSLLLGKHVKFGAKKKELGLNQRHLLEV